MRSFILGEFEEPETMVEAARTLHDRGFSDLDTHSPFPVEGAFEAMKLPKSRVPLYTLLGGLTGMFSAYLMEWWCNGVSYPIIVGGRPPFSASSLWLPHTIPIVFELGVLFASFGAFFGFFAILRFPRPYHPLFELESFRTATVDRFWVSVGTEHADRDRAEVERLLKEAGAMQVAFVSETGITSGHGGERHAV